MLDFIKNIGPAELIIIAIIVLLLFGAGLMKKLAKTSGESIKEMKNIKKEFSRAALDDDKSSKN